MIRFIWAFLDVMEAHYWVVHAVDAASGFQVAKVLPAKTTDAVLQFFNESWISHFGSPRTLICDSGPEFISEKMQAACDYHDVVLSHGSGSALDEWHCRARWTKLEDNWQGPRYDTLPSES